MTKNRLSEAGRLSLRQPVSSEWLNIPAGVGVLPIVVSRVSYAEDGP